MYTVGTNIDGSAPTPSPTDCIVARAMGHQDKAYKYAHMLRVRSQGHKWQYKLLSMYALLSYVVGYIIYYVYFKDLCVARCIHASESGNCTSRRIGTDVTCQWLPDVSTQSRVFISGSEIKGMVTDILVGGGAGEMAVGGKTSGREAKSVVTGGVVNKE